MLLISGEQDTFALLAAQESLSKLDIFFFLKKEKKNPIVGNTFQFPEFFLNVYYILVAFDSALAWKFFLSFL